jgi:hypothetical protein
MQKAVEDFLHFLDSFLGIYLKQAKRFTFQKLIPICGDYFGSWRAEKTGEISVQEFFFTNFASE